MPKNVLWIVSSPCWMKEKRTKNSKLIYLSFYMKTVDNKGIFRLWIGCKRISVGQRRIKKIKKKQKKGEWKLYTDSKWAHIRTRFDIFFSKKNSNIYWKKRKKTNGLQTIRLLWILWNHNKIKPEFFRKHSIAAENYRFS